MCQEITALTSSACPPGFGVLSNERNLSSNEMVPLLLTCLHKKMKIGMQAPTINLSKLEKGNTHSDYQLTPAGKLFSAAV